MFDINKYRNMAAARSVSSDEQGADQPMQTPQSSALSGMKSPEQIADQMAALFKDPSNKKPMSAIETFDSVIKSGASPSGTMSQLVDNAIQNGITSPLAEYGKMGGDALDFLGLGSTTAPTATVTGFSAPSATTSIAAPAGMAAAEGGASTLGSIGSALSSLGTGAMSALSSM